MPYSNKVFQIGTNSGISFRILRYLSYKIQLNQELFRSYTRYDSISILRYYLTRYNSIPLVNIWGKGSNTVIKAEYYSDWRLSRFTENVYRKKSRCVQVYKYRICYGIYHKDTIITKFSQSWHFQSIFCLFCGVNFIGDIQNFD